MAADLHQDLQESLQEGSCCKDLKFTKNWHQEPRESIFSMNQQHDVRLRGPWARFVFGVWLVRLVDGTELVWAPAELLHSRAAEVEPFCFPSPSTNERGGGGGERAELCPWRHHAAAGCRKLITGFIKTWIDSLRPPCPSCFGRVHRRWFVHREREREWGERGRALASGRCPIHPTEDTLLHLNGLLAYTGLGC